MILEKLKQAKRLKEIIEIISERVKEMERNHEMSDYSKNLEHMYQQYPEFRETIDNLRKNLEEDDKSEIKLEKRFLVALKERLTNVDIYGQRIPYICLVCREKECVCSSAGIEMEKSLDDKIKELF